MTEQFFRKSALRRTSGVFRWRSENFFAKIGIGWDFNAKIELAHSKYRITVKFFFRKHTSPINIYLLRKKYDIEVAELKGILFRRYNWEKFGVKGGIFYADGEPVAMYWNSFWKITE